MNSIAALTCASALLLGSAIYPQAAKAEEFTGKEFSAWSEASQNSYIQTSITMAGVVAAQYKKEVSLCIDDWYFGGDQQKLRNQSIREAILKYENYHPSGVILALVQEQCGKLDKGL